MTSYKTPICILDFEASGLSSSSYPIEVGVVGEKLSYSTLICPDDSWIDWSEQSESVHGIPIEDLSKYGKKAITVAKDLNQILDRAIVYTDCKKWDQFWLDILFNSCGLNPTFYLKHLPDELSDAQGERFLTAYERIKHKGEFIPHRALDDAS